MILRLKILNSVDGNSINAEFEGSDSVGDIAEYASEYWNKSGMAFVMKIGNKLVPANSTLAELGISDGDTVVLVPDPQGG